MLTVCFDEARAHDEVDETEADGSHICTEALTEPCSLKDEVKMTYYYGDDADKTEENENDVQDEANEDTTDEAKVQKQEEVEDEYEYEYEE